MPSWISSVIASSQYTSMCVFANEILNCNATFTLIQTCNNGFEKFLTECITVKDIKHNGELNLRIYDTRLQTRPHCTR